MTTFRTTLDVQQDQATAARRAQEVRCLNDIFKANPTLVRNEANARLILDDLRRFIANDDDWPTLSWWELMIVANPSYTSRLATTTEAARKASLIDQIIEALRTGGAKQSEWDLAQERKKLQIQWTVQMLEDRLSHIREQQRLSKMTIPQIQKEIAASRPQAPARVVLPVEYSVRSIKSMGVDALKTLIRTYGTSAVNDRLFGRS